MWQVGKNRIMSDKRGWSFRKLQTIRGYYLYFLNDNKLLYNEEFDSPYYIKKK